jgi:hypothetical protein
VGLGVGTDQSIAVAALSAPILHLSSGEATADVAWKMYSLAAYRATSVCSEPSCTVITGPSPAVVR